VIKEKWQSSFFGKKEAKKTLLQILAAPSGGRRLFTALVPFLL